MRMALAPEQEQLRSDVCALLSEDSVRAEVERARRAPLGEEAGLLDVYRRLGERGWLAPNWPVEHGGLGRTLAEKAIVTEELMAHGVPDIVHTISIDIVGTAVNLLGTDAQRARWLPRLASGEGAASVLFSEPDVGSDLSRLTTRAEPDGDGWRLHGRKVYSMKSHVADFALCAARTTQSEVRYQGITVFLLPLRAAGVLVERLPGICDEQFGSISLQGVRLTGEHVLGAVDDGWQTIGDILGLERTGIEFEAKARRWLDQVLAEAARTGRLDDPGVGAALVELDAAVTAGRALSWRAVSNVLRAERDDVLSAMAKWHTTETAKRIALGAADACGLDVLLHGSDQGAVLSGMVESAHREAPGLTLASGTSEIMLYLIASTGLGLVG
ncbi:MAG: acyl-CoA dehydrogenase family protein [Frankiaceae bacterium]